MSHPSRGAAAERATTPPCDSASTDWCRTVRRFCDRAGLAPVECHRVNGGWRTPTARNPHTTPSLRLQVSPVGAASFADSAKGARRSCRTSQSEVPLATNLPCWHQQSSLFHMGRLPITQSPARAFRGGHEMKTREQRSNHDKHKPARLSLAPFGVTLRNNPSFANPADDACDRGGVFHRRINYPIDATTPSGENSRSKGGPTWTV